MRGGGAAERLSPHDHQRSKKRLTDGSDPELGLLYYLFSSHNWGLADLRALWEGETGWHDLILALSSYEANQRAEARKGVPPKKAVKATKKRKK